MPHYVLDARTATPHFPGIGRYVSNLAYALAGQLLSDETLTVLHHPAHVLDFPVSATCRLMPVTVSPFSLAQQWVIPRILRQLKADLYHSAYYLMPYAPGVPAVLTLHDIIPLLLPEQSGARARLMFRWMTALALHATTHVIVVSEATRRDVQAHFDCTRRPLTVIAEAADPQFRPASVEAIAELRAQYTLPDEFLLYLGSNKPHKNLTRLVEAYAQLQPLNPPPLVIAGAWLPEHPEARERAAALGLDASQVRWLGRISCADMPTLYTAATLFVFPSLYEGFGLPPLEAMACGTPVACANTSSLPEVVGDAAVLFNPTQVGAIVDALRTLLGDTDLRADLRQQGLAQAAKFSWTRTARETLALYRKQSNIR